MAVYLQKRQTIPGRQSFSVSGCARPSLSFIMLTISPSVCCRFPWVMVTLWNLSDVLHPYCSNSSILLCSIHLLHVLNRCFLGESYRAYVGLKSVIKSAVTQAIEDAIKPLQDSINKQNDQITSLKAENDQMKGKLNRSIEDWYDKSWYHILNYFRFQHTFCSCFNIYFVVVSTYIL
jgi:hypothetical protein